MLNNQPSKEEILEALKEGVKCAFHEMMESGDGCSGPIRTEEVMEAIQSGIYSAFPTVSEDDVKTLMYHAFERALSR